MKEITAYKCECCDNIHEDARVMAFHEKKCEEKMLAQKDEDDRYSMAIKVSEDTRDQLIELR